VRAVLTDTARGVARCGLAVLVLVIAVAVCVCVCCGYEYVQKVDGVIG